MKEIDYWIKVNPQAWAEIVYDLSFALGYWWAIHDTNLGQMIVDRASLHDSRHRGRMIITWAEEFVATVEIPVALKQNMEYDYILAIDEFFDKKMSEIEK